MQSPSKLNKINPRLSGSRREQKSYTDRYREKAKPVGRSSPAPVGAEDSPSDLSSRGERIIELVAVGCDPSTIRIEEEADEYQIMKNEYMETELMWSKMTTQTRNDIHELREQIKAEQKAIKDMEKVLTAKRTKLTTLEDRLASTAQALHATPLEDYDPFIANLQEEYDTIDAIGEREITAAKEECSQYEAEGAELDHSIAALQAEIQARSSFSSQKYNSTLSALLQEDEQLRAEMSELQREAEQIARRLREVESERPIKEEVHRKYLELYEKMFVNRQLQQMANLLEYKQEEMHRLEDYGKRKAVYRQRRQDIIAIEERITLKRQRISELEQEIRDRSTILLNLHQLEAQRR